MKVYYNKFSDFLKKRYGEKVWKISLDAGFSCPNCTVDGTEGCIYCRNDSFSRQASLENQSVAEQMEKGIRLAKQRLKINKYLAYFQASTNTFAAVETLQKNYRQALSFENVVGISISTRPDCLPPQVLDLIARLSEEIDVWVELGLQSSHDRTLNFINRGHLYKDFLDAVEALKKIKVRICAHLMLGLPGEDRSDMLETARKMASLAIDEVKLHPVLILKETELERLHREDAVTALSMREYVSLVVDFIELLPPDMVIQRLTAEAPKSMLIAPQWSENKMAVLNAIAEEFKKRNTSQGAKYSGASSF